MQHKYLSIFYKTNSFFQKAFVVFSLLLLLNAFLSEVNAQVERVEPPFWWSGMKNSEIEILETSEENLKNGG